MGVGMLVPVANLGGYGEGGGVLGEGLVGLANGNQGLTHAVEGAGLAVPVTHLAE